MKNLLLLGLALMTIQPSMARDDRRQGPGNGNRGMDLVMCLKTLNNAEYKIVTLEEQLRRCDGNGSSSEVQRLREENSRLSYDISNLQSTNYRLQDENRELRRQLEMSRPTPPQAMEVFSYAACTDSKGKADTRYISSATAAFRLEAEAGALKAVHAKYTCNFGATVVETAPVLSSQEINFCTAACISSTGIADNRYSIGGRGRSISEAKFNALKATHAKYTCNYGVEVTACE